MHLSGNQCSKLALRCRAKRISDLVLIEADEKSLMAALSKARMGAQIILNPLSSSL